ncbi:hypothetical protein Y013_04245 [Rhodococcus pyridinivorans SB3094]|uniref:Uncharacterized protein n=1 Tax=Rhodococcus pyridinivorans SB3094 TaxID=1435356 RepID=V9XMJ4_9NOCA|nr:hypothetical protein Y013_04245 [Rhodococcus pyridinivorans SB3094]
MPIMIDRRAIMIARTVRPISTIDRFVAGPQSNSRNHRPVGLRLRGP